LMEAEVLYSPKGLPGCSKEQAEAIWRDHCQLSE
jgi:hypothetical protein